MVMVRDKVGAKVKYPDSRIHAHWRKASLKYYYKLKAEREALAAVAKEKEKES